MRLKKLITLLSCVASVAILAGASSVGLGPQYAPTTYIDPGTYTVPLADCSLSRIIIVSNMTGVASLDLANTAPVGTVCNIAISGGNYNVTVQSTGAVFAEPDGSLNADVVCTNDVGNDVYGCKLSVLKISSGVWTCLSDPYGNWIW